MSDVNTELTNLMEAIKEASIVMLDILDSSQLLFCELFELPTVAKKQENDKPDFIPVISNTSEDAYLKCKNALFDFYGRDGLSTKAAQRVPAYIHIMMTEKQYDLLSNTVDYINEKKDLFKAAALSIENPDKRFETIHSLFEYLITLNVYRHIRLFKDPDLVTFYWLTKPIISRCDRTKLLSQLEKRKKRKQTLLSAEDWVSIIKKEISIVNSVKKPENLRFCREAKSHPVVRAKAGKVYPAPMPVIIASVNNKNTLIEPLGSFEANSQKKSGPKEKKKIELIKRLNLFVIDE